MMPEESSTGSFGEEGVQGRCSAVCRFCGAWTVRKEVDKDSEVSHLHPIRGWNILAKRCTWTRNLPGMAGSLASFEDSAPHVECWRFMGNTWNGWRHSGRLLGVWFAPTQSKRAWVIKFHEIGMNSLHGRAMSCVFIQLTKDDAYWAEKVNIPASAWVAAGAKGQPVAATEAAVKAHVPGLQDTLKAPHEHDQGAGRCRQSNKDKRLARKRKFLADMDELRNLRAGQPKPHHGGAGGKDSGGKGGGKSKDQSGAPLCFSWASGTSACGPGAEIVWAHPHVQKVFVPVSPGRKLLQISVNERVDPTPRSTAAW